MIRRFHYFTAILFWSAAALAAHSSTDLFVPIAGSTTGLGGVEYRTALWITNVSERRADIRLEFLRSREPNPSPSALAETFSIEPGRTAVVHDIGEFLRVSGVGALRINASLPVVATARLFSGPKDQPAATLGASYSAIPAQFAVGRGQSTVLQGVRQDSEFRYNVAIVETLGRRVSLDLELRDHDGRSLGRRSIALQEHEQRTISSEALFPGLVTSGATIVVRPVGGGGKVIVAGSQLASISNDASGFEMYTGAVPARRLPPIDLAIYAVGVLLLILIGMVATRRRGHPERSEGSLRDRRHPERSEGSLRDN